MKKELRPHVEEEKLGVNPFLSSLKIPVNKLVMEKQYMTDKDGLILPLELTLERDSHCRVYVDAVRRKHMSALKPRAKDLLLWIIYETDNSRDWLWLNKARYMQENGVSAYNTYISAVRELIMAGFIQSTVMQNVYWINPHFFFNGNRVNKFPKNVVRR